jgi:hypothetical protein
MYHDCYEQFGKLVLAVSDAVNYQYLIVTGRATCPVQVQHRGSKTFDLGEDTQCR